ncbi:MAG: DHHA1 domain-containing protein [Eggerthellaceae bacterium]|nr:DHHA1 domain-containing protein [Eggerthellaceae bacterium]
MRFVFSFLSFDDVTAAGAENADAELMIDTLRSLAGVRVACFVRETGDGARVSLRAKDATDVALIAAHFGGGGHKAAAGCSVFAPFEEALAAVRAALETIA